MSEKREQSRLEATLREAQSLSDEDTKILQAALAWDVEDVETAKRLMEESEASQVWPEGSPERRLIELRAAETAERLAAAPPDGWQGTEPAQGTRRELIRNALRDRMGGDTRGLVGLDAASLAYADVVEEALLKVVDQGASPESGSPASVAMNVLDRMEIDRTRGGKILTIAERVTELADELVACRCECDRLEIGASVSRLDTAAEESTARKGRELHVVLKRDDDDHSNLLFLDIDNERGESVGGFERRDIDDQLHIVIPVPYPVGPVRVKCPKGGTHSWPRNPNRDGTSCLKCGTTPEEATLEFRDDAWVSEVAYQVAGAATRPLLEDHPSYVFPAERVRDAVAGLLKDFGIARACRPCAEEEIEHGRKETGDRRDAAIKSLQAEADRLLEGREQARGGEDHFKAQRDSALELIRWLVADLVPADKRLD